MRFNSAEKTMHKLLSLANIEINGNNPWDIKVNDQQLWQYVMTKPGRKQPDCRFI